MERSREKESQVEAEAMASCALMLLSSLNNNNTTSTDRDYHNEFECKTCNKRFPSFQALGGHRASHKRPKLLAGAGEFLVQSKKNKMHECSICGMEFSLGQALGGHMRRHRDEINNKTSTAAGKTMIPVVGKKIIPVLKKSNSSKRVFCGLDLNLTPDVDVDMKLWPTTPVSSPILRIFIS